MAVRLPRIPVMRNQKHELEKLNEGLLFADGVIDPSQVQVLELLENVQIKLAEKREKEYELRKALLKKRKGSGQ